MEGLLRTLESLEADWNPPESGELADAIVAMKNEADAALPIVRERLRDELRREYPQSAKMISSISFSSNDR